MQEVGGAAGPGAPRGRWRKWAQEGEEMPMPMRCGGQAHSASARLSQPPAGGGAHSASSGGEWGPCSQMVRRGGAQLCSRTGRVTESTVPRAGAASGKPLTSSRGTRRVGRPHHKGSLCASAGPALGWPSPAHSALAAVPGVGTVLNPVHRGEPGPGGGPGLPETSQPMKGELGSGVQEEPLSALYCTPNPSWPQPCTVPQPHQCLQR